MWKRSYYTVKFYPDGKHVKVQVYLCEVLVIRFHPLVDKYWYWFLGSSEDVALGQGAAQTADPARHYLRTQPLRNCSFRVWQVPIRVGSDLKTAPKLIGWKKKEKRLRVWFSGGSRSLARTGTKQPNSLKQSSQVQRFKSWGLCSFSLEQSDKLAKQYCLNSY